MTRQTIFVTIVLLAASRLTAQSTSPAMSEGPLTATITGVEGIVQVRTGPDQPWQKATVGMELAEGAELRTGPKSAVRFVLPPDQTITLDRLGTLQLLRANFQDGKIVTDLGMKYGRTRYDIEAPQRQYDAKVHSPSAVLAVRGTKVSLYDQPPFAPQAVSLTGRAFFRDVKKQVAFGSRTGRKARISQESDSAAAFARQQTVSDPRGKFSGRSDADNLLQLSLAAYGGSDFSNLGVLAFLDQARAGTFKGSLIGALPIGRQLAFYLFWTGDPLGDVDLSVTSPRGEVVSPINPTVASSGHHLGNGIADESGIGQEQIVWEISYPPGQYKVRAELKKGQNADAQIYTIDDPLGQGQLISTITGTLTPSSPTVQGTVVVPQPVAGSSSKRPQRASR